MQLGLNFDIQSTQITSYIDLRNYAENLINTSYTVSYRKGFERQLITINLHQKGWVFDFNDRKQSLGVCKYHIKKNRKAIELSSYFFNADNFSKIDEIKDVVLHEIAHALDYEIRGRSGHDKIWKSIATQVGARPMSRGGEALNRDSLKGKYTLECPCCGTTSPLHRKPKKGASYTCGLCMKKDTDIQRKKRLRQRITIEDQKKYILILKENHG